VLFKAYMTFMLYLFEHLNRFVKGSTCVSRAVGICKNSVFLAPKFMVSCNYSFPEKDSGKENPS